jgi:hypothetical protein
MTEKQSKSDFIKQGIMELILHQQQINTEAFKRLNVLLPLPTTDGAEFLKQYGKINEAIENCIDHLKSYDNEQSDK